jgi:hypothetical protein
VFLFSGKAMGSKKIVVEKSLREKVSEEYRKKLENFSCFAKENILRKMDEGYAVSAVNLFSVQMEKGKMFFLIFKDGSMC